MDGGFRGIRAGDSVLTAGDPMLLHNAWPRLWAEVNARAVAEAGRTGDVLFFMRSGFSGVQRYCPLLWGGDQSVDFSRHDGLPSAICAALSSGLVGNPYHHSDIGGIHEPLRQPTDAGAADALDRDGGVHRGDAHA